jgi:hypothetical protein
MCFQVPNNNKSGIHHVAHAQMMGVTPSTNGRIDCKNGIPLSVRTKTEPALALMEAAPITTHSDG